MGISRQQILQVAVQDSLLKQEVKKLGLSVGDDKIASEIAKSPTFLSAGQFDKEKFQQFLYQNSMRENKYREHVRDEITTTMLMAALLNNNPYSNKIVERQMAAYAERRDIIVATIPTGVKKFNKLPTDKELEDFYFENSFSFERPETRDFRYIVLKPEDRDAAKLYEIRTAIDDEIAGGSTLIEIAEKHGLKLQTEKDFSMESSTKFSHKFADKVSASPENEITYLDEDEDGSYYALKVLSIDEARVPPLEEIRTEVVKAWKEEKSLEQNRIYASEIYNEARATGNLVKVAEKYNMKLSTIKNVAHDDYAEHGFVLVNGAFNARNGEIFGVFDNDKGGFDIAAVKDIKSQEIPEQEKAQYKQALEQSLEIEKFEQYMAYLQEKHGIIENPNLETTPQTLE